MGHPRFTTGILEMTDKPESILTPDTSILIVDDSSDYAQVLRRILQNGMGYHSVVTISSIEEAYNLIAEAPNQFSMLFVDYHFPNGHTGSQLLDRLKSEDLLEGRVTFFITAEPAVQKAVEATNNGLAGVVIKPFDRDQLKLLIERAERDLRMERMSAEG